MPLALNANAVIKCSHMGTFKMVPTVGTTVMIGGAPAIVVSDMAVPQTPCPMTVPPPAGPGPTPCLMLAGPAMMGMSMKVMVKGQPLLMQTAQWMMTPTPPSPPLPGSVMMPGNMTVNVNG